jgi:sugar phosphate isomerase/epimerase
MRLGGPLFETIHSPDDWIRALQTNGYRAARCPVGLEADDATVRAYEVAAKNADIVIAEVGAWSNPLSSDPDMRAQAIKKCIRGLELADRIGAICCVNTAGSRGTFSWYGPHPDNLSEDTFDMIVETTRKIIDAVNPTRSVFALEPMP